MENKKINFSDIKKKNEICKTCISKKKIFLKNKDFINIELGNFYDDNDKLKIKNIIKTINKDNFYEFTTEGVEIGKICLYNFMIRHKIGSLELDDDQFYKYKVDLENCLISLFCFIKILKQNCYDLVISYASEYSINRVCIEYAKLSNIKTLNIASGRQKLEAYNHLKLADEGNYGWNYHLLKNWEKFKLKKNNFDQKNFESVRKYLNSCLKSSTFWDYSKPITGKNIKKIFNVKNRKIVLVATTSMDEINANTFSKVKIADDRDVNNKIFKNDIEWCQYIINEIAPQNPNSIFFIRPHPRNFLLPRNRVLSSSSYIHRKISNNLPENVIYNFPEDKLSIYDFLPYVDLLLCLNSSTTFEFGLFGIQTIIPEINGFYYPADIPKISGNLKNYSIDIKNFLNKNSSLNNDISIKSFMYFTAINDFDSLSIKNIFQFKTNNIFIKILNKIDYVLGTNLVTKFFLLKTSYDYKLASEIINIISNYNSVFEYQILNKNNEEKIDDKIFLNKINELKKYLILKHFKLSNYPYSKNFEEIINV